MVDLDPEHPLDRLHRELRAAERVGRVDLLRRGLAVIGVDRHLQIARDRQHRRVRLVRIQPHKQHRVRVRRPAGVDRALRSLVGPDQQQRLRAAGVGARKLVPQVQARTLLERIGERLDLEQRAGGDRRGDRGHDDQAPDQHPAQQTATAGVSEHGQPEGVAQPWTSRTDQTLEISGQIQRGGIALSWGAQPARSPVGPVALSTLVDSWPDVPESTWSWSSPDIAVRKSRSPRPSERPTSGSRFGPSTSRAITRTNSRCVGWRMSPITRQSLEDRRLEGERGSTRVRMRPIADLHAWPGRQRRDSAQVLRKRAPNIRNTCIALSAIRVAGRRGGRWLSRSALSVSLRALRARLAASDPMGLGAVWGARCGVRGAVWGAIWGAGCGLGCGLGSV